VCACVCVCVCVRVCVCVCVCVHAHSCIGLPFFHSSLSWSQIVEVYPITLKVFAQLSDSMSKPLTISRSATGAQLKSKIAALLGVPDDDNMRVWEIFAYTYDKLINLQTTLAAQNLTRNCSMCVEVKASDGSWPSEKKKGISYTLGTGSSTYGGTYSGTSTHSSSGYSSYGYGSGYNSNYGKSSSLYSSAPRSKGQTGLQNLGNTCFMNSALQCLSNCVPLREFFLSRRYVPDINRDNPIGCGGLLATEFARLLEQMWSQQLSSVSPRDFKAVISKFAPQFSGYQQHDSQELLCFVLDGLHEDLNRIRKKPYVEAKEVRERLRVCV
jgi:hypothetical protein